jgi:hypothetical protein
LWIGICLGCVSPSSHASTQLKSEIYAYEILGKPLNLTTKWV